MPRPRTWNAAEDRLIRELYGKIITRDLARKIGKTESGVYVAAKRLGLTRSVPRLEKRPGFVATLRARHAEGWSDAEIAELLSSDRHDVGRLRRRLGLGVNTFSRHRRDRVRAKTEEQCRAAGVSSLGAIRAQVLAARSKAHGWPEGPRWRAVQILNALWERGPMTRQEIAAAVGMPWKGSKKSLVSNDPEGCYLGHLLKLGLVMRLGNRAALGCDYAHSVNVYSIPLWGVERGHE